MFLIKSWFKSNHSSLTLWVHKRWFPLKVKWILTYIFLSLRILFFRIPVKAAPCPSNTICQAGFADKGYRCICHEGLHQGADCVQGKYWGNINVEKPPNEYQESESKQKKNIKYGKQRLLRRKWSRTNLYFWSSQWCFSRLITSQGK